MQRCSDGVPAFWKLQAGDSEWRERIAHCRVCPAHDQPQKGGSRPRRSHTAAAASGTKPNHDSHGQQVVQLAVQVAHHHHFCLGARRWRNAQQRRLALQQPSAAAQ